MNEPGGQEFTPLTGPETNRISSTGNPNVDRGGSKMYEIFQGQKEQSASGNNVDEGAGDRVWSAFTAGQTNPGTRRWPGIKGVGLGVGRAVAGRFRREEGSTEEPHEEPHYEKWKEDPFDRSSVKLSTIETIREIEGREPEPDVVTEALRRSRDKLGKVKVFGQPLKEMLVGAAVGGGAKAAVRIGLGISGVGVVEMAFLGAVGGSANAAFREYRRQRKELAAEAEKEEARGYGELRTELKSRLKVKNGRKIVFAAARGAAFGAVGGVVGGTISEMILDHIIEPAVSGIHLPEFKVTQVDVPKVINKAGSFIYSLSRQSRSGAGAAVQGTPSPVSGEAVIPTETPLPTETPVSPPAETMTVTPSPSAIPETMQPAATPGPYEGLLPAESPTPTDVPAAPTPSFDDISGSNPIATETEIASPTATTVSETPTPTPTSVSSATPAPTAPVIPEAHEFAWVEPSAPAGSPLVAPSADQALDAAQPDVVTPSIEPAVPEPLEPTSIHGHTIAGSAIEDNLTFDGEHWAIVDNGVKNINHVFDAVGETGAIDRQALAAKLQEATTLYAHGQLDPSANEDLYKVFHLSNGTGSIFNDLVNDDDTLESLKNLGIVK